MQAGAGITLNGTPAAVKRGLMISGLPTPGGDPNGNPQAITVFLNNILSHNFIKAEKVNEILTPLLLKRENKA
jgi:hypothetical protein